MRLNLLFASVFTIGILAGFVFFILLLVAFFLDLISLPLMIVLTILINVILWLVTPFFQDWVLKHFYHVQRLSFDEFFDGYPEPARFLQEICNKHTIPVPLIRIILDNNPTAYCFGSYAKNARLVVSQGIFTYLDVEEQKAVIAHEIGHIVNHDFIIMTIASTLLQILYEVYYSALRVKSAGSGKNNILPLIGLISFVLYLIGSYLLMYLSRTREYLADRFSAEATNNPDALSMALVKIAYGITAEIDTKTTQRLLGASRTMGICDYKAAQSVGSTFKIATKSSREQAFRDLSLVFLFDIASPWALISELNSTHPLTGKRIRALTQYAREAGFATRFNFNTVEELKENLDKKRLYGGFLLGLFIYALPVIAIIIGLLFWILQENAYPVSVLIIGVGFLIPGFYKFQRTTLPEQTTVFELMKDPYANPLRGRFVELQGTVIGKADAGSYFSEDVTLQDRSECLIYLNYQSILPLIGDLYFGLAKAKKLINEPVTATGWFRRSSYQVIDLFTLVTGEKIIKSYVQFWGIILGIIILVVGLVLLWFNPAILFSDPSSMIQYERIHEIKDAITAYFR